MYFRKICGMMIIFSFVFAVSTTALGARLAVENERVYGHRTLNGETVFLTASQNPPSLFRSAESSFYLQKVFSGTEKPYYYCYMSVSDSQLKKNPEVKMHFRINDKEINLVPFEHLTCGLQDKKYSGWYKLDEIDVDGMLNNLQSMHLIFSNEVKTVKDIKISEKRYTSFKRLANIKEADYIREGIVFEDAKGSIKDIITPQVYLPNVKPKDVQWAIFNQLGQKEKEKYSPYRIGRIWKGDNPLMFAIEGNEDVDNSNSFITFVTTPYKDGLLFKMYKNQKHYTSYKTKYGSKWSNSLMKMVESYGGIVNMCDYWRSVSDDWDNLFFAVYDDLHGQTNYGFDCSEEKAKDGNGNVFYLKSLDKEQFPELVGVNEQDMLKLIDGADTSFMRYMDIKYRLVTGEQPLNIVVVAQSGKETMLTVKPKFESAKLSVPDLPSPLENLKVHHDDSKMIYDEENTFLFAPLEPSLENVIKVEEEEKSTSDETVKPVENLQ